jgi:uncharacterized Zn finger protein
MSYHYRDFYPPASRPRAAKGGIKAQTTRGEFGQRWWGKRWLAVLNSFGMDSRLARGRSYARKGQVLDLSIAAGSVTAEVQGSRPRPYAVEIALKVIPETQWQPLAKAIGENVAVAAALAAGEMPEALEEIFDTNKTPLFPKRANDLKTSCSCPDYANPCKHVAAVYYLLAEAFDRDPFLLLQLRGRSRKKLMSLFGGAAKTTAVSAKTRAVAARPLTDDPRRFWGERTLPHMPATGGDASAEPVPAALRLGHFPFWRGQVEFLAAVTAATKAAARRAAESGTGGAVANGEAGEKPPSRRRQRAKAPPA